MPMQEPEIVRAKYLANVRNVVRTARDRFHISEQLCYTMVMEHYAQRCVPPLTATDAAECVRRVYAE